MRPLTIAEIVGKLQSAKTKTERLKILKDNDCAALRGILRMNFDASLVLALPDGAPPFREAKVPDGFGTTTLKTSAKGWYVFVEGLSPGIKQSKREQMFITLLESLDKTEASILIQAKEKKLDLGLTKRAIDEAFPGLIQTEGIKNVTKKDSSKDTEGSG